jgi:hypothetical protein
MEAIVNGRFISVSVLAASLVLTTAEAAVSPPVLKWQRGGCTSFCQTGWYSSPAVFDLDGDGQPEVIWGSYDLVVLQGSTGALRARAANPDRVWPGVAVADLNGDGTPEIAVGRGGNHIHVYRFVAPSTLQVVWSTAAAFPAGGEVRTLAVEDLESDGQLEVIAGRASGGSFEQITAFTSTGALRVGFPARRTGELGYGWGMYNENVAVADIDGDGFKEIFGPTDTHYITALDRNGSQLPVSPIYTGRSVWSEVGVHVDQAADLRGYANCGTEHRPNFANSAPVVADVDGDGTKELVVIGDVYNCAIGDPDGDLYHLPFILKKDRTRWTGSGFDWTVIPAAKPGSGPLSQDYNEIENSVQDAVVADLDGDGRKEILYSSYDGRVHAFWLDKTEHGNWPYRVPTTGGADTFRFAGEPVVADLDNDGKAEVIFTSWPRKATNGVGHLHILDYLGNELHRVALPAAAGTWNGGLAAPTLANIDADPDLEVVVGTSATGVVAYDLPNTASAVVQWGTGRGTYRRAGTSPVPVPNVSIADASQTEGPLGAFATLSFPVTLSVPTTVPVSVGYSTTNGTATAGPDYTAASGTLLIPAGQTTAQIPVAIRGDRINELTETFTLTLSSPINGVITVPTATGTILDDDPAGFSIDDVSVSEPATGTRAAVFTVTVAPGAAGPTTVQVATANGTAASPGDFAGLSTTLSFPPFGAPQTVTVNVNADAVKESTETFTVNLSNPTGGPSISFGTGTGRIYDPGAFATVTPCRAADTRSAEAPALAPGADRAFAIGGRCGVPVGARAASINVTVTQPTQGGDLRIYAAGTALPLASTINYSANQTRANNAIVPLNAAGQIAIHLDQVAGSVQVILDVNGYVE